MRMGIMQPYFFPYPGHFALIAAVDQWVVFDLTQYTPKTWISRNRVLHPSGGANWINVPLANSSISVKIHEARVLDLQATCQAVLGKLSHYRRRAPYARQVEDLVRETFAAAGTQGSLVDLDVAGLVATCARLELPFRYQVASRLTLDLPEQPGPGDWAPAIAAQLGAATYVNPASGRALFDPDTFRRSGLGLEFLHWQGYDYPTPGLAGEPGLSILDALMWNRPEDVRAALSTHAHCERVA